MTDNGFVGNASHIYPRIVQPAPEATSDRDKMCQIISEAVGGWNQNTQAITRVAAALSAAGFGLAADAKAEEWGVRWQAAGPFPEEVHAKPSKDAAEKSLASSAFPGVIVRRTVSEWEAAQ